jgi:hypothetical protein
MIKCIKCLVAGVALIALAGYAVAQETVHRRDHHHHHRHHMLQSGPSPDLQSAPSPDTSSASIYWSPAGGNPIHYAQTTGFYAGR